MAIHESGEMYLETIHVLMKQQGAVRSIDISSHMGYSKPSVSRAVGVLKKDGYILVDKDGFITLTDSGLEVAEKIYARHQLLTRFLTGLGVSEETAAADACRMEHAISDESFNALQKYLESNAL